MSNYIEIKAKHEASLLEAALQEHNRRHGFSLRVVDRPDPPDAILSDGSVTTWMELTNAFFSQEWAQDLFSYAADGPHKPMKHGPYINMDAQLAENLCTLLYQKSRKCSYKPFLEKFGPGILVIGLEIPWFDSRTLDAIDIEWANFGNPDISGVFNHVYLKFRNIGGINFNKLEF